MLRLGLLTSTAMTAVALLSSGAPAQAQTDMHVADRDANARFLCTYGQFEADFSHSKASGYGHSGWEHVAVPIIGHGQTVTSITVMEARNSRSRKSRFLVGIHSNSPSGFPGNPIAWGKADAPSTCGTVTIDIPPTTLMANTKYWIEERAEQWLPSGFVAVYWEANPKAKHRAYVQTYRRNCNGSSCSNHSSSSYTSPWTKQTMGPWFKLK